jgi:hypothetical protein
MALRRIANDHSFPYTATCATLSGESRGDKGVSVDLLISLGVRNGVKAAYARLDKLKKKCMPVEEVLGKERVLGTGFDNQQITTKKKAIQAKSMTNLVDSTVRHAAQIEQVQLPHSFWYVVDEGSPVLCIPNMTHPAPPSMFPFEMIDATDAIQVARLFIDTSNRNAGRRTINLSDQSLTMIPFDPLKQKVTNGKRVESYRKYLGLSTVMHGFLQFLSTSHARVALEPISTDTAISGEYWM